MTGSGLNFVCFRAVLFVLGFEQFRNSWAFQEEEHDELGLMSAHEFDELHMCEEPPPPLNGELICSKHKKKADKYVCKAECDTGYQFFNGKKKIRHICDLKSGKWNPEYVFPDCIPICDPPCKNGECTEGNHCICLVNFRGDRCQYDISLCDPNTGLNMLAECNHTSSETKCKHKCPRGTKPESMPSDVYKCSIDGSWEPNFAPNCIPINVLEAPRSNKFYAVAYNTIGTNVPQPAICSTWSGRHYRTFDGGIYSFQGSCNYLLSKDCEDNTFAIHLQDQKFCGGASKCSTSVVIYAGPQKYIIANTGNGYSVYYKDSFHAIPTVIDGLLFQLLSHYVFVTSSLGFKLKWDGMHTVHLEVSGNLKNKTCGLCGKFDGDVLNDFQTSDGILTDSVEIFVHSWVMENIGTDECRNDISVQDTCSMETEKSLEAEKICRIVFDVKFSSCLAIVDPTAYYDACKMDYCSCSFMEGNCFCDSLAEYFQECLRLGVNVDGNWRNQNLCPLSCPVGMTYSDCGTSCPRTCKNTVYACEDHHCIDGCRCPNGTFLHNGRCLELNECPCLHNGQEYVNGARILQNCNACECTEGKWQCTHEKCEARCSSTGDPHYTTFDGVSYEFLGSCSYYLVFNDNFTVIQKLGACSDTHLTGVSENMFCTHAIRVEYFNEELVLKYGIEAMYNNKEIALPFSTSGFTLTMATDTFVKVSLDNGLSILWDGLNRIYIDASPELYGQTAGLCGTFNHNQNDDFLSPNRDIEADVETFAARWQVSDSCHARSRRGAMANPCYSNPQRLHEAEMLCSVLKGDFFAACHNEVEPYKYYKSCVTDVCTCSSEFCVCPILADYSLSCSRKGIILSWTDKIEACKPKCFNGQVYKECGNPCTCSCLTIALEEDCQSQCVQGCSCPDGMTLSDEGYCIPIDQCPCYLNRKAYSSALNTTQANNICTCSNAKWHCKPSKLKVSELENMQSLQDLNREKCFEENNEVFTECRETCRRTCQNSHLPLKCDTEICTPGCKCKEGYLLDTDLKKCVDIKQCGCIHGKKRYKNGETMKQDCNVCTCSDNQWQCTEKICPSICTAWGESHFKTYDGKIFDFQGECEYILSKGKMKGASFTVTVQNVPCGSSGITCSKSFTLELGTLTEERAGGTEIIATEETLKLTKDEPLPTTALHSRFTVLKSGLFVVVYTDVGLSLHWDQGTRIYISVEPTWRNRVNGLCGNFNDNQEDDFVSPFGGLPEIRASVFADSWRVHEFCPESQTVEDICAVHPQKKSWAQSKCGVLHSDVFNACRASVNVEPFFERCVFDACACDMGGDCDCLCTAIATFAQECNMHGVPVKWRSQELCPIQCEDCAFYNSCISSCPKKTCANEIMYDRVMESCLMDFCVEGCDPKPCPEPEIYNNENELKCIPKADCVVPCLEINGFIYNEGERITDLSVVDPCQTCYCHKRLISCLGDPCVKIEPFKPCLQTGWTLWMNSPSSINGDIEDLSFPFLKATYEKSCGILNVTGIECRETGSKIPAKETGQKLECSLPFGLSCQDNEQVGTFCKDYEIRVFCDCGLYETTTVPPLSTLVPLPPVCDTTRWSQWMNGHKPNQEGESETLENLRARYYFCAAHEIEKIECRSVFSNEYVSNASRDALCNKKLGFVCNGPDCSDYEVRVFCKCEPQVTETVPPVMGCVTGWTEYFNTDHPEQSDTGDDESIDKIRTTHSFCDGGAIQDIECKTLVNGELLDFSSFGSFGLKCSKNVGFLCNKHVRSDPCPDFMVRFYCLCEEAPTATTVRPGPSPVNVECGWTPWLNMDTPESGENDVGDIEDLAEIQLYYKTCGGKDLIDIECRMSRTHHSYAESLQKNLKCNTVNGFHCKNQDQIGKCYDYEVRLLCMYDWCYPSTTLAPTTTNPCPEGQKYDTCAYNCSQMCSSFLHEMSSECSHAENGCIAGCRPLSECISSNVWRDYYTCVSKSQCTCILMDHGTPEVISPNAVIKKDCEKCQCVDDILSCYSIPGCGTTEVTLGPRLLMRENITQEDCWTHWINLDTPDTKGGDIENLVNIRKHFQFCANPVKAECRIVENNKKALDVGQNIECDISHGLVCWNEFNKPDGCYDYEIRFFCPCPTPPPLLTTTPATPYPTLEPGSCIYGWTDWFNNHAPDEIGDYESIQRSRMDYIFCSNEMISAIQCKKAENLSMAGEDHQRGVVCDLQSGLICQHQNVGKGSSCSDYAVRFFCDCPTIALIIETTPVAISTKSPSLVSCAYWSEWLNENHPSSTKGDGFKTGVKGRGVKAGVKGSSGGNSGDTEKGNIIKLQRDFNFCKEGIISDIECREAETDIDYLETGENKLVCSLVSGFRCLGRNQKNKVCKDYKIRYFCSCEEIPTTPMITKPTVPITNVEDCTVFYDIIDGPQPLPDSRFKASTSKTSDSGPHHSRLSSVFSSRNAGAWIPSDINGNQFLEIDLGYIQPVYGVITKGRSGHQEWVKSYKVLFSRNGNSYAYVSDDKNNQKVFSGNIDSDTPVMHQFYYPFEARYIRIQPITFHKEIALRMGVLGCDERLTTTLVYITTTPPCSDDMGLSNELRIISDSQIKTSSDRNVNSHGRYVRLNMPQTKFNSGGWVAKDLDMNQYVQVDFVEPQVITGIKIQGRDNVPQWVTAFTVNYSQDGNVWNEIKDNFGGRKIFSGNYDSNSIVSVYFPQSIRTRFIRVHPISYENWIALRLEVLGCFQPLKDEVKDDIRTTTKPTMLEKCHDPMGFENHQLPDDSIFVSSSASSRSDASRIRLNTHSDTQGTGGWIAAPYDYKPIIVINFDGLRNLTGIETQGLEDYDKWIMSYYVLYSRDNVTWEKAYDIETGGKVFSGNSDRKTAVLRIFSTMIEARYLKLILIDYHVWSALRMEVLGCFVPYETTPPPAFLFTTTEFCAEYGPWLSFSDPASKTIGDFEPIDMIISASGKCNNPFEIECRTMVTRKDYWQTGQAVTCDLEKGLYCLNQEQSSYKCYNYEVRIKCWTCGVETTSPHPLEMCPEIPKSMGHNCPTSCPMAYVCDGSQCVSPIDCPCFRDGRKFQPPGMTLTSECQRCECLLGGYSRCSPVECPPCLPGQKIEKDDHCVCKCVGCAEGTLLCPTSGECVNETKWCDGVLDCPDDEIGCPTTATQTVIPTTTEVPFSCNNSIDKCEVIANMFQTFDGLAYQYDICDHVLMKEDHTLSYSVTIHKTCASDNPNACDRYLIIDVDDITLKIGPDLTDITVQNTRVPPQNLWSVSQRFREFDLTSKGNSLVFRSKKYNFSVVWNNVQDVSILVSNCLINQVVGLCGQYNRNIADDRTRPDGTLAVSNENFGNSWSLGSLERCSPPMCPENIMRSAIDACLALQNEPFNSSCSEHLKIESRIESCMVFMCECLQRSVFDSRGKKQHTSDVFDFYDTSACKCLAYESFVEACEFSRQEPVQEWRIQYECTPECPKGMDWQDCGPGCELTCDNYHERDALCTGGCTPGCYCPPGLIRHHGKCVKPKMCQDCVCRGHGDPNYITFDGRYYAFQGNCTYVLAQHLSSTEAMNFRILATNVECPEEPYTSCTDGLQVFWNGHVIEKFKNKPVYLDGRLLLFEDFPLEKDGISIVFVPGKSTIIHIKNINLAVRYFDQMFGFNIELPAFFYYNQTEGLCGVCNFNQSDDFYHRDGHITENIEDFAFSWLEKPHSRQSCNIPRVEVPKIPEGICNFTVSPCEVFLDPALYAMSCQNDITYSHKPQASMCRSKFQYAQQCCEKGISLVEWLEISGCQNTCPNGMLFECTSACPKTCDNYKNILPEDCDLLPLYTCTCPKGQVLKLGSCVDEMMCETCDALGHIVGDTWKVGDCEQCECMSNLSIRCVVTECPLPPICKETETLEKIEWHGSICCDAYQCVESNELRCPDHHLLQCQEGESNVLTYINGCPVYRCECMISLCPPLKVPDLDEGEFSTIEKEGCCLHYRTECQAQNCSSPPNCSPGFKLSTSEGKCCLKYACVPKKNVCVYQYKYGVVNGSQTILAPGDLYEAEYEPGTFWQDGLCRKCHCIEQNGQHAFSCREEICPDPKEFPDAEKYEREEIHIPGDCCPKYRRVSCKANGISYSIGDEWPSPEEDACKSYQCIQEHNDAAILERISTCDKSCPETAVYTEPTRESKTCCGFCKPIACEEQGILYQSGTTWNSSIKPCYKAECSITVNGTQIIYEGERCPQMPNNCPMESIRKDLKGCCTYCQQLPEQCSTVQVPLHESKGFFGYKDDRRGLCSNDDLLEELKKCDGHCSTDSLFTNLEDDFQTVCRCCLPQKTEHRLVTLKCADGSSVEKVYQQPSTCKCSSCSGNDKHLDSMNQIEVV